MKRVKVIKIGGNVVDNTEKLNRFLCEFAAIEGAKILVHGGGKIASTIGRALGIEPVMVDGRRVTDLDTLRVVTMVYGGLINKNIVATLQGMGCNAIGLTGADGALVRAARRTNTAVDFGQVGDPIAVNTELLVRLIDGGLTPVVAPLTLSEQNTILNTNADTMAQSVAVALAALTEVELCYTFEMDGVLDENGAVIDRIDNASFELLRHHGTVNGGMLPKIENALQAVAQGVVEVHIGSTTIC